MGLVGKNGDFVLYFAKNKRFAYFGFYQGQQWSDESQAYLSAFSAFGSFKDRGIPSSSVNVGLRRKDKVL